MSNSERKVPWLHKIRWKITKALFKLQAPRVETYETRWDTYAKRWRLGKKAGIKEVDKPGDEWSGHSAGLDLSTEAYAEYVNKHFIAPYTTQESVILEIGSGGGRMTRQLLKNYKRLICSDVSGELLNILRQEFHGLSGVEFLKTGGVDLNGVQSGEIDVVFAWAVFIRLRPYDIYAYMQEIKRVLKPGGTGILQFANILSPLGWQQFLIDLPNNLLMRNDAISFSVMTPQIMQKFLDEAGFESLQMDTDTIPRDCVVIFRKP